MNANVTFGMDFVKFGRFGQNRVYKPLLLL